MAIIETEVQPLVQRLDDLCDRDGDVFLMFYFSRKQDRYQGWLNGLDAGDALIVIDELVKKYNLNVDVLAKMLTKTVAATTYSKTD
jgi:hypothetical protein